MLKRSALERYRSVKPRARLLRLRERLPTRAVIKVAAINTEVVPRDIVR